MKNKLNILSLMLLCVFGLHIGYAVLNGVSYAKKSIEDYDETEHQHTGHSTISTVTLNRYDPVVIDSVFNEKKGIWLPVQTERVAVVIEDGLSGLLTNLLFVVVSLFTIPTLIICFYKIIKSVKNAVVFDRKNISRFRIMGLSFFALWFVFNLHNFVISWDLFSILNETEYSLVRGGLRDISILVYALISFLSAEILAVGLRLKEEQDLTI